MTNPDYPIMTLRVVNDVCYIETVLTAISQIARRFSMSERDIDKLCVATEEAMNHVINYAFSPAETAYFDVGIAVSGMDFTVTIRDKGKPFDFSTLALNDDNLAGLGVKMMHGLTDKLQFRNLGSEGREQCLIKYLVNLPLYQSGTQDETATMPEHIDFDIHRLKETEAIEVAQCMFDEFGYTYAYDLVYYPQQYYEACQAGEIYSLVATAPDGEVAGHLALMIPKEFPGIAEMGMGVVKRKFRKYSVMKRMTVLIIDHAQNVLNLKAMYAQPVAYHIITQKMCNSFHLTPCAFALHYTNDDLMNTFAVGENRFNLACAMLPFEFSLKDIYVPDEVTPMISEIIANMNLDRRILKGSPPQTSRNTLSTLSVNKRMRLGKCFIEETGANIEEELKRTMLTAKREKCAVVEMYINLSDAAAPYAYDCAKKHNFFCTGIMPQSAKGDFLMMECLMNEVVDYEEIKTIEPFTGLLNYIKKLDPNEN